MTHKINEPQPSRFCKWLIKKIFYDEGEVKLGDFIEIYSTMAEEKGRLQAKLWFWAYIIRSIPEYFKDSLYNGVVMFKNYLIIAFRNINKKKGYSTFNIFSLAVCIACFTLIMLWVNDEFSYDNFHEDKDRIFRIVMNTKSESQDMTQARVSAPLIPIIEEKFPEIESAARLFAPAEEIQIQKNDTGFIEEKVYYTDNDIFNILSFHFTKGNPENALNRPQTIVISETIAHKYFGKKNPIGSMLQVNKEAMEVSGVIKNFPDNTHLKCNILISLNTLDYDFNKYWGWAAFYSYVKIKQNASSERLKSELLHIAQAYRGNSEVEYSYYLQPLSEIHFSSGIHQEIESPGNFQYVLLFIFVGVLLFIIGCFNYTNMSIMLFMNRIKEVLIRKVVGAERSHLLKQFFLESFLITLLSILSALGLIYLTLPYFNNISNKHFDIHVLLSPKMILLLLLLTLFVSMLAGGLSIYYVSFSKSGKIFKKDSGARFHGTGIQKGLITLQFSIAIILIVSTFAIYRQINHLKSENLGFDKEQKLITNIDVKGDYESIKNELLKHPEINAATFSNGVPGRIKSRLYTSLVGKDDDKVQIMEYLYVDHDYIPFYNIKMLCGRSFEEKISSDNKYSFILNKAASEALGFTSPEEALGNRLREGSAGIEGEIIGVTDNFHFKGLQNAVDPLVMQIRPENFNILSLTINTGRMSETLELIKKKWNELNLGIVLHYFFLDEDFNRQYAAEEKMGNIYSVFTFITLFVLCVGLFTLMAYLAEKRTKEIGIRKVLGASVSGIFILLSKGLIKWVVLANIFAWPVAYYFMHRWLQNFAYRTSLNIWIFFLSSLVALVIALLTTSYRTIKAATANPVDSLRYE